jgi:hypothetical protein
MAFSIFSIGGEFCDKCGKRDERPMIGLSFRSRTLPNSQIFIHRECLNRELAKMDKREAKNGGY